MRSGFTGKTFARCGRLDSVAAGHRSQVRPFLIKAFLLQDSSRRRISSVHPHKLTKGLIKWLSLQNGEPHAGFIFFRGPPQNGAFFVLGLPLNRTGASQKKAALRVPDSLVSWEIRHFGEDG